MGRKQWWFIDDRCTEEIVEEVRPLIRKWFKEVFGMSEVKDFKPTGGYDGDEPEPEASSGDKMWSMVRLPSGLHGFILAHIRCNGEPRAVINIKDEEEFKWLKGRVDGLQPSQDVESRR